MRLVHRLILACCIIVAPGISARAQGTTATPTPAPPTKVPVIVASGFVDEWRDPLDIFGAGAPTLRELTTAVRKAAKDPSVAALVVRMEEPDWGMAQAMDFGDAMADFRASGKPLLVNFDNIDLINYVVATNATQVSMAPVGSADLHGVGFTMYFFRDLLAKLGAKADVVNTGPFKNALEPFTNQEMSAGTREQMGALLDDLFGSFANTVAANRKIDRKAAEALLTGGPYSSKAALAAGAVDSIAYLENTADDLETQLGHPVELDWEYDARPNKMAEAPSLMSIFTGGMSAEKKTSGSGKKIAVVYALGGIVDGRLEQDNPFLREQAIAAEDFIDLLEEAASEPGVVAMVVRVDSPGGSASASDRIWSYLETIREDMPVVASMGNVAASGGYYISMGADTIVAQPTTITGSIGVIGGKLTLGETYKKIGVARQTLSIGKNADLYSEERPWNDHERKALEALLHDTYTEFASKAAEGREMPLAELEKLAGGRVWSGVAAKENGLVDELGGLERAVDIARDLAKAKNAKVVEFPKELTFMELLEEIMTGKMALRSAMPAQSRAALLAAAAEPLPIPKPLVARLVLLGTLMQERPKVMAVSPWVMEIN